MGLGNPYATRGVTALPHFRIVLSRPASSPHFGEGINIISHYNLDCKETVMAVRYIVELTDEERNKLQEIISIV